MKFAKKQRENVFDYIPITFFVEVDLLNQKQYTKVMLPFMNTYYALEDTKKKAAKYFAKIQDFS